LGLEKEFGKPGEEKPRHIRRGKDILSRRENKPVLRIPPVVRISPVIVQPRTISIAFQPENIRVAVRVGFVKRAIYATALLIRTLTNENELYFIRDLKSTSTKHQVYLFLLDN